MTGFRRTRKGVVGSFSEPERDLLVHLLQQTIGLLEAEAGAPTPEVRGEDGGDVDSFEAIMRNAGFDEDFGDATARSAPGPGRPADPAVRRLLPDAHHDDPELAAEFRRLTGDAVRDRKLAHLRRAVGLVEGTSGSTMYPTEEQAVSLLVSLTDVRLVLAERLDLHTDEAAESLSDRLGETDPDDPRFPLALAYEFLTWVQETLAVALQP
ncbi:DUF2017 domain-containing protein [Mobilicoccus pelagius]|uniref:Uncharacterized protein n=1 Tax=Mobilicoccus pelagius NBRC 104925 TaxID=1089455 RepID=H5UV86_9MICO|nr:DUF2017 domain-containing protein [Mobilicoccus pelagius]GAB49644.1 hypothetical protein MOPEL_132_00110 [Mobilicoccus pelagius NBRC 104925]